MLVNAGVVMVVSKVLFVWLPFICVAKVLAVNVVNAGLLLWLPLFCIVSKLAVMLVSSVLSF